VIIPQTWEIECRIGKIPPFPIAFLIARMVYQLTLLGSL